MARNKTQNIPDLTALLTPQNQLMLAVEQAVLRGHSWAHASAPIAEQIAARLAGVITLDLVKAGQRLLENDISQVLHVSRAPVREALRILERDRMVEFEARRGAIVTAPDANELRDIYMVRKTLFVVMLRLLMEERPADLEAVFAKHMPILAKAAEQSVDDFAVAGFLMNFAMFDLCSNLLLVDLLKSIGLRTLRYVRIGLAAAPENMASSVRSWRALHKAIAKRDVEAVLETAARRIDQTRDSSVHALVASTAKPVEPPKPVAGAKRAKSGAAGKASRSPISRSTG